MTFLISWLYSSTNNSQSFQIDKLERVETRKASLEEKEKYYQSRNWSTSWFYDVINKADCLVNMKRKGFMTLKLEKDVFISVQLRDH